MLDDSPEVGEPKDGGENIPATPEEPKEATPERTVDTEIQTNIDLWKGLGVEVDPEEARARIESIPEIEKLLSKRYAVIFIPRGIQASFIWQKMDERFQTYSESHDCDLDDITSPRSNEEVSYAVAYRYRKEPDADTLGTRARSVQDWENTGEAFMSPLERMVAELRWHQEKGTYLDENFTTKCPGSRAPDGRVPGLYYDPLHHAIRFDYSRVGYGSLDILGVRRVIPSKS